MSKPVGLFLLFLSVTYADLVQNNVHLNDTQGNRIEAHSAGLLQYNGTWYWYGESAKTTDISIHGVTCYSSASLTGPWKYDGMVVAQTDIKGEGVPPTTPYVVERPKVIYNNQTAKFVMWFHLDDSHYKWRRTGIATADSPTGPFTFQYGFQPDGIPALDMSLWQDPSDGTAYFIRSCDNKYAGFSRLSSDYMNTTGLISNHSSYEGMALFRHSNGTFYIITSHLTGWNPNELMLFRAAGATLDDPQWVDMGNPTHNKTSFNTQPTYVVQDTDANGDPYFVYLADNWIHCAGNPNNDLLDACYIWLPMKFDEHNVTLSYQAEWDTKHPFSVTAN